MSLGQVMTMPVEATCHAIVRKRAGYVNRASPLVMGATSPPGPLFHGEKGSQRLVPLTQTLILL